MTYIVICVFILGAIIGSLLNVVAARLPVEKSIFWPGSHCGNCYQPVRFFDNIPLLSYWILRGRCRTCKARFSIRYFLVELFVACGFVAIFYFEIVLNVNHVPALDNAARRLQINLFAPANVQVLIFFAHRALLFSFLTAAALCDLHKERTIPLSVTLTGTFFALALSLFLPWPWPTPVGDALPQLRLGEEWWMLAPDKMQKTGLQLWPAWGPVPNWMPAGTWRCGLVTALAGAFAGTFILRAMKVLFERGLGKEALGLGDADLMMLVGAFLGWQPVIVAFLLGGLISLVFALPNLFLRGEKSLPFGPGLALGTVVTWLGWHSLGPLVQPIFFNYVFLLIIFGGGAAITFLLAFLIGRIEGGAQKSAVK